MLASRHRLREFTRFSTWTDIVAIISFLAPLAGEAGGFLGVLRTSGCCGLPDVGAAARRQRVLPAQ